MPQPRFTSEKKQRSLFLELAWRYFLPLPLPTMPACGGTACVQSGMQTLPGTPDFPAPRWSWGLAPTSLSGLWISAGRCNPIDLVFMLFACSQLVVLCNPACNHLMATPRLLSVPSSSKAKELACSSVPCSPCFTRPH